MRGLPGSGKSTKVNSIVGLCNLFIFYPKIVVVSADHFFVVDGEYKFNKDLLGAAHAQCLKKFHEGITSGADILIVDNTNLRPSEIRPYMEAAEAAGYKVLISNVKPPDDINILVERNVHGVPRDVIERMYAYWNLFPNLTLEDVKRAKTTSTTA
jgi:predicted ABC-type ATPase